MGRKRRFYFWIITVVCILFLVMIQFNKVKAASIQPDDLMLHSRTLAKEMKYGYMLISNGQWIIPPIFSSTEGFGTDQVAPVKVGEKYGFIDVTGKFVIQPQFQAAMRFYEDFAAVRIDNKWGFIDRQGKIVIQPQYESVLGYSEGLAAVLINGKWGFIDTKGNVIISPQYEKFSYFKNGAALVIKDHEISVINKSGTMLAKSFVDATYFSDGLAAVKVEGKWGFIDAFGNMKIRPQFDNVVECFIGDRAGVEVNGKWGVIDSNGNFIIAPQFESILRPFYKGNTSVKINNKWGVIDRNGQWLVPPVYNDIVYYYPQYKAIRSGSYYYSSGGSKLDHYLNHMEDANLYRKNREYAIAADFYQRALQINPNDEDAKIGLAMAKKLMELSAVLPATSTMAAPTGEAEAYFHRGVALERKRDFDSAIAAYNAAIKSNPYYAASYSKLGSIYHQKGYDDVAMAYANKAIEAQPEYAEAYFVRGQIYGVLSSQALADYGRTIQLDSQYTSAYVERGRVYFAQRKNELAINDFTKALELTVGKEDANVYYRRGNAYQLLQQNEKAILDYQAAILHDPKHGYAYFNLAQLQELNGDCESALESYQIALSLLPKTPWVVWIGEAIAKSETRLKGDWESRRGWVRIWDV